MFEKIREEVLRANLMLKKYGLVTLTWGNVSAITPDRKYVVIKPSGVDYDEMTAEMMVVTDLNGKVVEFVKSDGIYIKCSNGIFCVTLLQRQGKNEMNYKDFMNGARNFIGTVLGM